MVNIILGIAMIFAAVAAGLFGIRRRRKANEEFEKENSTYSHKTMMTVVKLDESVSEYWDENAEGGRELLKETVYMPTYEYVIGGKTYQYCSSQSLKSKNDIGRQLPGYYDPQNPEKITENKPVNSFLSGLLFFVLAAVLLLGAVIEIRNGIYLIG